MARFENKFSWSFSRHRTFRECRRQYFNNYYGSWNGWSFDGSDQARHLYRLKNIQSFAMWQGDVVHRMIERMIHDVRNQQVNTLEAYQSQARKIMNKEYLQSTEEKWRRNAKHNLNLFEHYYGFEVDKAARLSAKEKIFRCIAHFMQSSVFDRLAGLKPVAWKTVEDLKQFPVGPYPVYVKIDCGVEADGRLCLYDWKTGKKTVDTLAQLGCYALFAMQEWGVAVDDIRLYSVYLDLDEMEEHVPAPEELVDTKEFIFESAGAMIALLEGGDVPEAALKSNVAREENFPQTEDRFRCKYCNFREACYATREWPLGDGGGRSV